VSPYREDEKVGETEPLENAAIRGTVTHRLIETLWHEKVLPETDQIAVALSAEGMSLDKAAQVAAEILEELEACQKEPFFQWLLDPSRGDGRSEFAIEAMTGPGKLHAGILDFVKEEGGRYCIVDFKTSRPAPGEGKGAFVEQQIAYYKAQLLAYRTMLSKAKDIDPDQIRTGLYFTALQQWHEMASA
jgi:ATP-dependent exoDNAse (exonuclease V) beta subunit